MINWETGNVPVEHDYTHPERQYKGLVPKNPAFDIYPEEFGTGYKTFHNTDGDKELCWACGWSYYEQVLCYSPRVKIMHTRDNKGLWSLGTKWLIMDQPNDRTMGADYMTWKFLKEQPGLTIPLVEKMQRLSDPTDPVQFTLISRAQGTQLNAVWHNLTPEQKESYKDQLANALKQLRRFTAPFPKRVNGDELDDHIVGVCQRRHSPTCIKLGFNTEEWLENMSDDIR
ncbi:hypothetical protein RBB50_005490 [Rhinocladiella similis]